MSDYTKAVDFASKDALAPGNPSKVVKGTEIDAEFEAIETAVGTKLDHTGDTITSPTLSGTVTNSAVTATCVPVVTSSGETCAVGHRGKMIATTGSMTIPNSVFAQGDAFAIYNNSASSISITQGSGVTLRWAGTTSTGTRTLAARGLVTVSFPVSASEAVVTGAGLT
jgi:hypothetical protein